MSRAMELDSYHTGAERARARLFPPSKWAGLFPSAAYRRSAPPRLAWDKLNQCRLGCYIAAWIILQRRKQARFFFSGWHYPYTNNTAWDASMQLGYFCNAKCQCGIQSTLAFLASHEALRRMAVFPSQLARSHTRPASREARCRAAVTPQPSCMSRYAPARPWRAVRGQGRREEARIQWMQPPQAVSDWQPSTETRIWHGSAKDDD